MTLEDVGYNEWLTLDIVPRREDPIDACTRCISTLENFQKLLSRLDRNALSKARLKMDNVEIQNIVQNMLVM